jgi:hypothetical protein
MPHTARLLAAATLIATLSLPAFAAPAADATLLGVARDWSAFTSGTGSAKICYAISKPTATAPKAKRDPIYFLVTDWPGRSPKTKSEPEVVPGYQYKAGSTVTASVDGTPFELFTENADGAGAAWVRHRADEIKLLEAMKGGKKLVVTGTSMRGTKTTDTYSLAGFGDALDAIHKACGM